MRFSLCIIWLFIFSSSLMAQDKSDYIWMFANDYTDSLDLMEGSVIDFNNGKRDTSYVPLALELGPTNASICDKETGRLLFYTNGCAIIDSTHNVMLNGDDINPGELHENWCDIGFHYPSTNNAIILNDPSNDFRYYTIHRIRDPEDGDDYGVFYSYIDMLGNNGKGEVIKKNEPLYLNIDIEGSYLTACKHANGNDWWFVLLEKNTNRYLFFLINQNGISFRHSVEIGPFFSINTGSSGHACFSPDGGTFAWYNPHDDFHIFDFDRETGLLSNYKNVIVPEYPGESTEFFGAVSISPSNQFAYLSSDYQMYQVDLWANNLQESLTFIAEWDFFGDPFPTAFTSIMHGPDCKMYLASGAAVKHLGVIHYPDNKGMDCEFKQHDLELPWHKNVGRLPNFPHFRIDEENPCDDQITNTNFIPDTSLLKIKLVPNPTSNQLYFSFPEVMKNNNTLFIYNSMGQLVKEELVKKYLVSKNVDVSELKDGIYYYQLSSGSALFGAGSFVKI